MAERSRLALQSALQVPPERIAAMSDTELDCLMRELLQAQAYESGARIDELRINTETKARDDGCDGWSGPPRTPDPWLGDSDTCWQFKAGTAGQPRRIASEVTKDLPRKTLERGGRFVLVASGSKNGIKGESDRREALLKEASAHGILGGKIDVIGSDRLARWCNQHPAVAAHWAGRPPGLWTFGEWADSDEHRVQWQGTSLVEEQMARQRQALDLHSGELQHLHIFGPPGVGKTRFALELCRGAAWRGHVLYVRQAADVRLDELIDSAVREPTVHLVVVVDEVRASQLRPLRDSVGRASGRVRLISIGHEATPDAARIPALRVEPLEQQAMSEVVRGWNSALPLEHLQFVVQFADGYVRLAKLAVDAVVRNPNMPLAALLGSDDIQGFLDKMLGTGSRRALHVVAALWNVGWFGEKQAEGKAIAEHFSLDWNWVRAEVESYDRRFRIVPRGGRFRYVSPRPLAEYLALEAWAAYPDLMSSLPDALPTVEAQAAYHERLVSMAGVPEAQRYACKELSKYVDLSDFFCERAAKRWSALSAACPEEAARRLHLALKASSLEERYQVRGRARRELVRGLVSLAWKRASFPDAVRGLALFAHAENETWANNASAEFEARFQIHLGGTAVPYRERLELLDDLLEIDPTPYAPLVARALARAGDDHPIRMSPTPASSEVPELEWEPATRAEHLASIDAALQRLVLLAERAIPEAEEALVRAAETLAWLIAVPDLRPRVMKFYEVLGATYAATPIRIRRTLSEAVRRLQRRGTLTANDMQELETFLGSLVEDSTDNRLRLLVGERLPSIREQPDLRPLAGALLLAPHSLQENWAWLTSGEAHLAGDLGEALGELDSDGNLMPTLLRDAEQGPDLRVTCGYVKALRSARGDRWYEQWFLSQQSRRPRPDLLLFESVWRCGATDRVGMALASILRSDHSLGQGLVGRLVAGRWVDGLSRRTFLELLSVMAEAGHGQTAIQLLGQKFEDAENEEDRGLGDLALKLVMDPSVISAHDTMAQYFWEKVALALVDKRADEICAAILSVQADEQRKDWFAAHSPAGGVLAACAESRPEAFWRHLREHLSSEEAAYFTIGFPDGAIQYVPHEEVLEWVAQKPHDRGALMAKLSGRDLSSDETLTAKVLAEYGDIDEVAAAYVSEWISGVWWGSAADHWEKLAAGLDEVASRTNLPKLRHWAVAASQQLRAMADQDRQRDVEFQMRRR